MRAYGRNSGRPSALSDEQIKQLKIMVNDKNIPVVEIVRLLMYPSQRIINMFGNRKNMKLNF